MARLKTKRIEICVNSNYSVFLFFIFFSFCLGVQGCFFCVWRKQRRWKSTGAKFLILFQTLVVRCKKVKEIGMGGGGGYLYFIVVVVVVIVWGIILRGMSEGNPFYTMFFFCLFVLFNGMRTISCNWKLLKSPDSLLLLSSLWQVFFNKSSTQKYNF